MTSEARKPGITPSRALRSAAFVLLAGLLFPAEVVRGQSQPPPEQNLKAYVDLVRKDMNKAKTEILGQAMGFSPEQAAKFWPIYSAYTKELNALGDVRLKLIKDYADNFTSMDDQKADNLARRLLTWESQRAALKQKYYAQVQQALGGKMAARFLQVENRLLTVVDLQIAAEVPLVE